MRTKGIVQYMFYQCFLLCFCCISSVFYCCLRPREVLESLVSWCLPCSTPSWEVPANENLCFEILTPLAPCSSSASILVKQEFWCMKTASYRCLLGPSQKIARSARPACPHPRCASQVSKNVDCSKYKSSTAHVSQNTPMWFSCCGSAGFWKIRTKRIKALSFINILALQWTFEPERRGGWLQEDQNQKKIMFFLMSECNICHFSVLLNGTFHKTSVQAINVGNELPLPDSSTGRRKCCRLSPSKKLTPRLSSSSYSKTRNPNY
ncbi:uncharacterized protein LOC141917496 [Strix aluco]|uniref:uncharacterized protein LOC141917496 n=1 Tax=Strix aluco TaxID=111821 RepID=UPI003DA2548F